MKKICYMMLVVLCVLLTLSGCRGDGSTKTTAVRSEMVDDITQPWALSMQYYAGIRRQVRGYEVTFPRLSVTV